MYKQIYISKHKYYYYGTYATREEAYKTAKYKHKKNKCKYFILKQEKGYPIPTIRYHLYLNKACTIW